jgi:hypothetical protein
VKQYLNIAQATRNTSARIMRPAGRDLITPNGLVLQGTIKRYVLDGLLYHLLREAADHVERRLAFKLHHSSLEAVRCTLNCTSLRN